MKKFFSSPKIDFLFNVTILMLLFVPVNQFGIIIQSILTIFILLYNVINKQKRYLKYFSIEKFIIIFLVVCSFVYSASTQISLPTQSVLKILNIVLIITFFPLAKNFTISRGFIVFSLIIILVSQISYMFNISFIVNIIDNYYTSDDYFSGYEKLALEGYGGSFLDFRFGGLYRNPNQCGRILTLLLSLYLIAQEKISKLGYIVITVFFISVLLTGSRTTLLISTLLIVSYFVYLKKNYKILIYGGVAIILLISFGIVNLDGRIFDFSELNGSGQQASVSTKLDFLMGYIEDTLTKENYDFLLGTFNIDDIDYNFPGVRIERFDSEIGYLIHGVGVLSLLSIIFFFIRIFTMASKYTRFIMLILIWVTTSTILTNFRFATLYMLILSMYFYKQSGKAKTVYQPILD